MADAVHYWINVLETVVFETDDERKSAKKRFRKGITDCALVAYMLHPKYKGNAGTDTINGTDTACNYKTLLFFSGERLDNDQLEKGRKWLNTRNPYYVVIFSSLQSEDDGFFPRSMLDETLIDSMDPISWWKALSKSSSRITAGFIELVDILLRLPASTSGLERSLSTLGRIMCKERSRLGVEKAAKLCFVSFHSKQDKRLTL